MIKISIKMSVKRKYVTWEIYKNDYITAIARTSTTMNKLTIPARLLMLFLPSDNIFRLSINETHSQLACIVHTIN